VFFVNQIVNLIIGFEEKTGFAVSEIEIEHETFAVKIGEYAGSLSVRIRIGL
jgi:hypothetical protein